MDLKERFEKLKPGTKVLLKLNCFLGGLYYKYYRYLGNIKHDGYLTDCGAWSLYNIPTAIKKCYSIEFEDCCYKTKKTFLIEFYILDFEILESEGK